jgi:serine/threonine-protein kinase
MELAAGTLIGGRYRLERLLGRGGMGEVWAAQHTVTRREVALKFLSVEPGTLPQMRRRFLREARAATAVNHPNVIQVHDLFELEDETPVMVMDLLSGEALGDKLAREGSLSVEETARIMAPVVSAVGTAHSLGIVHRDLKPENIFLCKGHDGEIEVKVLDFGIAKFGNAVDLNNTGAVTGTGAVLGTPYYMALEQAYGEKDIDHRADVWSLGVVLYECLSGRRPIDGDNFGQIVKFLNHGTIPPLSQVAPSVPEDVSNLVGRMLQRAREDRPQDLREVLTVLRRYTGATARTFGGARRPDTSGVHDAPDLTRVEGSRNDAVTLRAPGAPDLGPDPHSSTIEVASAEPRSEPRKMHISTGKKASPVDVTLAESAAAVPAPPPRGSHRTALIAGGGALVGIALTAVVLLVRPTGGRDPEGPATGSARVTTSASDAPGARESAAVTAQPLPSAAPVDPPASASAPVEPASSQRPLGRWPLSPSGKPSASAAPSAKPSAGAPPPPPSNKPKGGLVDEPPF